MADQENSTTPPVVSLNNVTKTFPGGVEALGGIDLDVAAGEFLTIIGASGAGKSTILRLMTGLDEPTSGTLTRAAEAARPGGTAMVFQDPALMPWASSFENVRLPLRLAGTPGGEATERIVHALETVGLADRRDALPRDLSGGMRMRVSIARALVTQPKLILLDEPFGALDEITRFRLNDVLLDLWREQGLTIVLVTHSVFEAAYLSTRVTVLSAPPAKIMDEIHVPREIIRNHAFRQSAGYLDYARKMSEMLGRGEN
ncbi:MAG: ABC transporter ATP-binding protein [Rhodobiaceae bacterium]|nr:ABC transporter ATP-binding protein [Rhodobiaceae bacterium]